MRRVVKWVAIVLGLVVVVIAAAAVILSVMTNRRLNKVHDVAAEAITIPTDAETHARGAYLATAICAECHGNDLGGELLMDEAGIAAMHAPNITPSEDGVGGFSDADYVRAIRHGIGQDGRALMIMPAEIFVHWSEEDLAAVIAYLKTVPPVDRATPPRTIRPLGGLLLAAGMFGDVFAAEYIDHDAPFRERPPIGPTAAYGEYFAWAGACTMCHGAEMTGGGPPPNIPEIGEVPSALSAAEWTTDEFVTALTTGERPDGTRMDTEKMPWELYARFRPDDIIAVHEYLKTLGAE